MMVVVTGSSTSRPAKPKKPPAAPLAADISVCERVDAEARGSSRRLDSATRTDRVSAACTAECTRLLAPSGSLSSADSSGLPTMFVSFATTEGDSSSANARSRASRSWAFMSRGWCSIRSMARMLPRWPVFPFDARVPPGFLG
jgi:hypothetical protein